ncbi:MAG: hypothetical protein ACK5LC_15840 [Coprobacillaceae bacterium]
MKDLIVVGDEFFKAELYIESFIQEMIGECSNYAKHLGIIFEEGIGDSAIKDIVMEQFSPLFSFFAYYTQGKTGVIELDIIKGLMEEFISNIDMYDFTLY